MERLNKKTLSFPAMVFTKALAALGIVLTLAACGKGGSGGTTPIVGINGCQNCGAITAPTIITNFNSSAARGEFSLSNMQIYSQAGLIRPNGSGNNFRYYDGPIAMQGQLVVQQPLQDLNGSGCHIPAGTYAIQTLSVGQLGNSGQVVMPSIITPGGEIELKIDSTVIPGGGLVGDGVTGSTSKLYAWVSITRAFGYVCSSTFGQSIF